MQRSIGREFKSPSPDLFLFARLRPAVYRGGGEQAGIFGLVGYDARFTRERSPVRSWVAVRFSFAFGRVVFRTVWPVLHKEFCAFLRLFVLF